ncbi:hypothetical protein [Meiothermus granaticius]|uniref:Uncharacterized protein n=1 Tax=Meiothermus granaticius NBRC 107808 TaxID=1227551 RepID=A0A399FFM4_9DEIN|nr:hypothetical protein [Meiothermus granaticius]RIH94001.1 hypothetical protein Mgrana_00087 [Meiothermus granaticius NBRC 107808]
MEELPARWNRVQPLPPKGSRAVNGELYIKRVEGRWFLLRFYGQTAIVTDTGGTVRTFRLEALERGLRNWAEANGDDAGVGG